MTDFLTKDGAQISIRAVEARVYDRDSGMEGRIGHAKVGIYFGAHTGTGQFSLQICPCEARAIATWLIVSAKEADASEMALMDRMGEEA